MDRILTANKKIKKTNRSQIFNLLYKKDSLSKRDIQLQLGLSLPTVTQHLTDLLNEGLIFQNGYMRNTGGRNAITYSFKDDAKLAIGLDITRHHITAVVINLQGAVIAQLRIRYTFERTDTYLRRLGEVVNQIISENAIDISRVLGVGVGLPGLTNASYDRIVYGKILDIEDSTTEDYSRYIHFPVRIFNDANAACDIELYSTTNTKPNGFYIMLSNNVGGAIFINDSVYTGDDFRSGEIGHLNIHPGGLRCYCGQRGCVDPYCSATVLTAISDGNLNQFFELLEQGDQTAQSIWSAYLQHLALAIRNVRVLFDCPIIIGGYVGAYIDKYLDELKQILDTYNSFDKNSDYVVACKYKTESIAAGAALYFVKKFLSAI
ncbi:MAG: ROK family transcriptional regulator [Lachnospiraceae bacterium]|jgi:Transcriptional regulator/sugar kinase|nr:ROK family transcriptional regulator [Lachnospiraceae bacterium]